MANIDRNSETTTIFIVANQKQIAVRLNFVLLNYLLYDT